MELVEDIHLDAVGSKNVGSDLSELRAVIAAVK